MPQCLNCGIDISKNFDLPYCKTCREHPNCPPESQLRKSYNIFKLLIGLGPRQEPQCENS